MRPAKIIGTQGSFWIRALVTGGGGFIGSHLCDFLLAKGWTVVCMDNFITGSERNIAHLSSNPSFQLIRHDVSTFIDLESSVDCIFHFASPASPADFQRLPIQILKVGALGTHNTLGLAKAKKAKYLLASTSEVYGDPEVHPQPESYWGRVNPIGIRGVYDEAKRFAEAMTMAYHRIHAVETRIVRIFNTYGPRMRPDDGRIIPNLATQALTGQPLTVYGDGSQTRSFCHVSDLVDGIYRLMESNQNQPVNLGNPKEITVLELAQKIKDISGSKSEIVFHPLPTDDPKRRCPDLTRARTLLHWEPRVPVEEGLRETLDYFRKVAQAGNVSSGLAGASR